MNLTFGYDVETIRRILRAEGVPLRNDGTPSKFTYSQLMEWHGDGWTARRIADHTGAGIQAVLARMAKAGISPPKVADRLPVTEIVEAYAGGSSLKALATQHSVQLGTIRRLVANNGGTVRTNSRPPAISPLLLANYCRRGYSVQQISDKTGSSRETINRHLKANGLQVAYKQPGHERPAISRIQPPKQAAE